MTLSAVAADDPIEASLANQLIANVNGSPGRHIYTSNGTFSVPTGVHKFKITLCGGGGEGGDANTYISGEESTEIPGGVGGLSPLVSVLVAGQEIGTSFAVVVGAGGTTGAGGTSSVGTLISVSGGAAGGNASGGTPGARGAVGTVGGSLAAAAVHHVNTLVHSYISELPVTYGTGGAGETSTGGGAVDGIAGVVIIEY